MFAVRNPRLARTRAWSLFAIAAAWDAACGGPQPLGSPGTVCFRPDDCVAGLECVQEHADSPKRVCSADLSGIVAMVDGAAPDVGQSGGGASSAGAAHAAGAGGSPSTSGAGGSSGQGGTVGRAGSGTTGSGAMAGGPAGGVSGASAGAGGAIAGASSGGSSGARAVGGAAVAGAPASGSGGDAGASSGGA